MIVDSYTGIRAYILIHAPYMVVSIVVSFVAIFRINNYQYGLMLIFVLYLQISFAIIVILPEFIALYYCFVM